jgi:hypothetical protein
MSFNFYGIAFYSWLEISYIISYFYFIIPSAMKWETDGVEFDAAGRRKKLATKQNAENKKKGSSKKMVRIYKIMDLKKGISFGYINHKKR